MSRRKKHQEEESYETAEGFQIEDINGNAVDDDALPDEVLLSDEEILADTTVLSDKALLDEGKGSFWDDEDEPEDDEHFNSIAENEDWEEGYDY